MLAEHDMYIREETGELEDLCVVCRKASQTDTDQVSQEIDNALINSFSKDTQWDD
jgi:hypothetical protein